MLFGSANLADLSGSGPSEKTGKMHANFASWCEVLIHDSTQYDMKLFAYITWELWNLRNDTYHGKKCSHSFYSILSKANALLDEFKKRQTSMRL